MKTNNSKWLGNNILMIHNKGRVLSDSSRWLGLSAIRLHPVVYTSQHTITILFEIPHTVGGCGSKFAAGQSEIHLQTPGLPSTRNVHLVLINSASFLTWKYGSRLAVVPTVSTAIRTTMTTATDWQHSLKCMVVDWAGACVSDGLSVATERQQCSVASNSCPKLDGRYTMFASPSATALMIDMIYVDKILSKYC